MTREEFLKKLKKELSHLEEKEQEKVINYYDEMILDGIENGKEEQQAIEELGTIEEITKKTLEGNTGYLTQKKHCALYNVLKISGLFILSPLWASLVITYFALLLTAFMVVFSLYICALSTFICALVYIPTSTILLFGHPGNGLVQLGVCMILLCFSILFTLASIKATKGVVFITKKSWNFIVKFVKEAFQNV